MTRTRLAVSLVLMAILAGIVYFIFYKPPRPNYQELSGPNFLIIISDDQRTDSMEYMPRTKELIFDEGVDFDHAYITTPQCCPSRSSILTGMYAHNHGVTTNSIRLKSTTFIERLHKIGYRTGISGKYLNSYPTMEKDDQSLPEFDYWVSLDSGNEAHYLNPMLSFADGWRRVEGYQTHILRDSALEFLRQPREQSQPFLLYYAFYAPHRPTVPAPGDEVLYTDVVFPEVPSFNEADRSDKPMWLRESPPLSEQEISDIAALKLATIQTLHSADESIAEIIEELDRQGVLDDTFIIYLSDNGRMMGEHAISGGKIYPYEETIRVPFAIRYPPLTGDPHTESSIVANIDIAPTIYELAGVPIPAEVDGRSLVGLLHGTSNWREAILTEGWPNEKRSPSFVGVRSSQYLYVENQGDLSELYDMNIDPFQLDNRINDPEYAEVIQHLQQLLAEYLRE